MPVMSTLRGRESTQQQRSWGTRYDSLVTSPTPSQALGATVSSDGESEAAASVVHREDDGDRKVDNVFEDDSFKTSWADDEVPEMFTTSPSHSATASPSYRASRIKMPHNASVFIGSLPTNMGEAELKHALLEHLSQFANVHRVKLIHDHQKGFVSAFVQCEDADQAAQLISKSPKPFQGRMLRFETARAHRSLYLSYKKPRILIPSSDVSHPSNESEGEHLGVADHWVDRELPMHMRVVLPQDSKCALVHYDTDALEKTGQNQRQSAFSATALEQLGDKGRLFLNIEYDEKTMYELALCFGPIEYFQLFVPSADEPAIPSGHEVVHSSSTDERVWEVKWEHRDDCITALNTFKTMPHICASWTAQRSKGRVPTSPASFSNRLHPGVEGSPRSRDFRTSRNHPQENSPGYRILNSPRYDPPSTASDVDFPSLNSSAAPKQPLSREDLPVSERLRALCCDGPDRAQETISSLDSAQTLTSDTHVDDFVEDALKPFQKAAHLDTSDLPAPTDEIEISDRQHVSSTERHHDDASHNEIDISSNPDEEASVEQVFSVKVAENRLSASRPAIFHRRSLSNPAPRIDTSVAASCGVPTTPELSGATYSPESPLSAIPHTPLYPLPGLPPTSCKGDENDTSGNFESEDDRSKEDRSNFLSSPLCNAHERDGDHRQIDPKTIFVGGLENTGGEEWDDQRLRTIFGRYGKIELVKYVRQNPKKAAFAFITFSEESAPPKAIAAEHNRVYGGRAIRVQIRDIYPMRSFKYRPRMNQRPRFGVNGQFFDFGPKNDRSPSTPYGMYGRDLPFDRAFPPNFSNNRGFVPFSDDTAPPPRVPPFVVVPRLVSSHRQPSIADSESFPSSRSIPDSVHSADSDARTAVSITPPPPPVSNTSMPTAAVVPGTPQSSGPSPVAYYHPQPWPSPYGPAMFPVPVGTYGPIMPQVPFQYAPLPNAGAPMNQAFHWAPPAIPYQYVSVLPAETPRSSVGSAPETPAKGQAPLSATGFVQGEHGGLIPIYQQEALNQYMAGASQNNNTQAMTGACSDAPACTSPVGPSVRPMGVVAPQGSIWTGGTAQTSLYAYPPSSGALSSGLASSQPFVPNPSHGQIHGTPMNGQPWRQTGAGCMPTIAYHPNRAPVDQSGDMPSSLSNQTNSLQQAGGTTGHTSDSPYHSRMGLSEYNYPPRRGSAASRLGVDTSGNGGGGGFANHLRSPARLDFDRHGISRYGTGSGLNGNPAQHQMNLSIRQGNVQNTGQQ